MAKQQQQPTSTAAPAGFGPGPAYPADTSPAADPRQQADAGETETQAQTPEAQPTAPEAPLRQGAAPVCPRCKTVCKANGSPRVGNAFFTYYRCQSPNCSFSAKVPRENMQQRMARAAQAGENFSAR